MKDIEKLMSGKISKHKFLRINRIDSANISDAIYHQLNKAVSLQDSLEVEKQIYLIVAFHILNIGFVDLLNELILMDWHKQHENIAALLQKLKSPKSIDALYETVTKSFRYLEFDDSFALAVKCIWALGDIGTDYAKEKLEYLVHSSNLIISDNAMKQLERFK